MLWMTIGKIIGAAITIYLLYAIVKELKKSIKESNEGRCSGKCELD
jgi:hypothetical protein